MKKYRVTNIQLAIIEAMKNIGHPLSLAELNLCQQIAKYSFTTLYRNVKKLESSGFLVRVDMRERGSRFELADLPHHHHLICEKCGLVKDITDTDFSLNIMSIEQKTGFKIKKHIFEVRGICKNCNY